MKPAAFAYARPRTLEEAVRLLAENPDAKLLAGGQTLGPMLNLRLVQPGLVVDITRIEELARVEDEGGFVTLGACVTHAAIEDGRITDPSNGFLAEVAHGIAYRAVRNRGTIGGSLAHADPAADWLSCLTAIGADILLTGPHGRRRLALGDFVRGAMDTELRHDEIVDGVRIPKFAKGARAGFAKICRKTGEFAEAIGVAVSDAERGVLRLVAGATQGRPIVIDASGTGSGAGFPSATDARALREELRLAGFTGDSYELNVHAAALGRAVERAQSR
jgi:carbon-monoxide dehydrogenase medium subunit